MSINYTPRTWVAAEVVTAAEMNTEVRDFSTGVQAAWTSWTPTVSTGLTVGNGSWTGGYTRIGKTIEAKFAFIFGTTSAITTTVALLFPIAINTATTLVSVQGTALLADASVASARVTGSLFVNSTAASGVGSFVVTGSTVLVSATSPFTWTTSDVLSGTIVYEAA